MKCKQCKQDTTVNDSISPWVNELVCTKCIISGESNSIEDDEIKKAEQ